MAAPAPRQSAAAAGPKRRPLATGLRIRTPKTSEVVADQIRAQIVRGDLKEGDSLPPEGQLMDTLGISRPTLREAFRILEAENLISVVRGSRAGASVHQPRADVAARYAGYVLQSQTTTIADLYEARQAIEPFAVRMLCRADSKRALAKLRAHLDLMANFIAEGELSEFLKGTSEFHRLLVEVSGNKTLTFLNHLLLHLIGRHQAGLRNRHPLPNEVTLKRYMAGQKPYLKLVSLIEAKDEDAAVAHWRLHLKNAHATWVAAGEGERIIDSLGS